MLRPCEANLRFSTGELNRQQTVAFSDTQLFYGIGGTPNTFFVGHG